MNAATVINDLEAAGISLYLDDLGDPHCRATRSAMTDEAKAVIAAHKPALVEFLRAKDAEKAAQEASQARFDASARVDTPDGQKKALNAYHEARDGWFAALDRHLTDGEKTGVDLAFDTLKKQHGKNLHAAGWTRDVVFGGMDPTTCQKVGDIPGVIGLLMAGGRLVAIHPDRLDLEFPDGTPFIKIKGSVMIGGTELKKYLHNSDTKEERT